MKNSESLLIPIRGLQYHARVWGAAGDPPLFMLHGFQDASASWQFTVDELQGRFRVIAPDWRGYGESAWSGQETYWTADFIADLDALLDHFEPEHPVDIVGHSMGAHVASFYAGVVPDRVRRFVNIEGLGPADSLPDEMPRRLARWLRQIHAPEEQRPYDSFEEFAERLSAENPHITPDRALFLARHWGKEAPEGGVIRRADPAHKVIRPVLFRADEAIACWRRIKAEVLWVEGAESESIEALRREPGGYDERLAAFQTLVGVERIADAGHNVQHDQPEKLAALIDRFMQPQGLR
ncbi:MAG: alpha/beta hydrolase [Alphaproteobacteria bacterium]